MKVMPKNLEQNTHFLVTYFLQGIRKLWDMFKRVNCLAFFVLLDWMPQPFNYKQTHSQPLFLFLQYLIWKSCPKTFCQQHASYPISPVKFPRVETGYAETSLVQKSSSTEQDSPLQAAPPAGSLECSRQLSWQSPELLFLHGFSSSNTSKDIYTADGRRKGKGKQCTRLCCFCIPISSFSVPFIPSLHYLCISIQTT